MYNKQVICETNATTPEATLCIVQKIKDTLNLSAPQKDSIYAVNMLLHHQKLLVRQQYASNDSAIRVNLQQVENTRDSLYRTILNVHKYQLYLQKKRNLVSSN